MLGDDIALRTETTRHHDVVVLCERGIDLVEAFIDRGINEPTRIDDDDIDVIASFDRLEPVVAEKRRDGLAIDERLRQPRLTMPTRTLPI